MVVTRDESAETSARKVRQTVGIDDRFCPDMIYVLSELKRLRVILDYVRKPDNEMPGQKARWDADTGVLEICESTYRPLDLMQRGYKQDRRGARFTVAHEIVHITEGQEGIHFRGPINATALRIPSRLARDEALANRIAAAILVPFHLAGADKTIEDMSELFDVNISVTKFRKPVLERMDRRVRGIVPPLPDSVFKHLQDAEMKGYKVTSLAAEYARRRAVAMTRGYEGTACEKCNKFSLKRVGDDLICDECSE